METIATTRQLRQALIRLEREGYSAQTAGFQLEIVLSDADVLHERRRCLAILAMPNMGMEEMRSAIAAGSCVPIEVESTTKRVATHRSEPTASEVAAGWSRAVERITAELARPQ